MWIRPWTQQVAELEDKLATSGRNSAEKQITELE